MNYTLLISFITVFLAGLFFGLQWGRALGKKNAIPQRDARGRFLKAENK